MAAVLTKPFCGTCLIVLKKGNGGIQASPLSEVFTSSFHDANYYPLCYSIKQTA
jgi:hypothetical protein